jgi:hypothetical protein
MHKEGLRRSPSRPALPLNVFGALFYYSNESFYELKMPFSG